MPRARRKKDRVMQISRWLAAEFPCAYPVYVRIGRIPGDKLSGFCIRRGKKFYISLDDRPPKHFLIETLFHEWAHALTWKHANLEKRRLTSHDEEWGIAFARIFRRYMEEDGEKEADAY